MNEVTTRTKHFVAALDFSGIAPLPPLNWPKHPVKRIHAEALTAATLTGAAPAGTAVDATTGLQAEAGLEQAYIVGNQLVSFDKDVTEARRTAAVTSCLAAYLQATKQVPDRTAAADATAWQHAYINVLTGLGWLPQGALVVDETSGDQGAAVDKVVLEIAGALLGGGTALALATKVIGALKSMNDSDPFITLYSSRSIEQSTVDFNVSLGTSTDQGFILGILDYRMDAVIQHQQVLFFKWDSSNIALNYKRWALSLDDAAFEQSRAALEAKVAAHIAGNVAKLDF